mgnify:CR=1 FL=1|tara:strand:+ start:2279 stop:2722 length:444 start_codon:yes stop_codon:yes gene_type:complete
MKIDKLKSALSNYPTGIVCVFSKINGNYNAIIVNSFTSVSLNPPIVLWSLDKKSSKFNAFKNSKSQIIVILSKSQKKFANQIAFYRDKVSVSEFNKILKISICSLYCSTLSKIKAGDHFTFFMKIKKISNIKKLKPLVYYKKKFLTI